VRRSKYRTMDRHTQMIRRVSLKKINSKARILAVVGKRHRNIRLWQSSIIEKLRNRVFEFGNVVENLFKVNDKLEDVDLPLVPPVGAAKMES
jgi:hypothetical protein